MWRRLMCLAVVGCGSSGTNNTSPDGGVDALVIPDPDPDPVVSRCTGPLGLPGPPSIMQRRPLDIALADFNLDGAEDFVVVEVAPGGTSGALITYTGNGAGSFASTSRLEVALSIAVTSGDLDGDGHVDLALVGAGYNGQVVTVLKGAGDGTFAAAGTYPLVAGSADATLADLDQDNKLDVIVRIPTGLSILLGNGDGTLQARTDISGLGPVAAVVAGRFDSDLDLDLAITGDMAVSLLPGNGDGTFGTRTSMYIGYPTEGIAAGDFDQDGDLDLMASHSRSVPPMAAAHLLLNNGVGTFAVGTGSFSMPIGDLAAADVDGDTHLDLISLEGVLRGNGAGSFAAPTPFATPWMFDTNLAVGSFDGDNKADVLVTHEYAGLITPIRGAVSLDPVPRIYTSQGGTTSGLVIADFNTDTRPDFAILNYYLNPGLEPGTIAVFLRSGDGYLEPQVYPTGYAATSLLVTDFNQDGHPDLAASHGPFGGGAGVTVLINAGGSFTRTYYPDPIATRSTVAGDFDHDGTLDLVRSNGLSLILMHGLGDGTFTDSASSMIEADSMAAGDLDGDGDLDLVLSSSDVVLALNRGDGTFSIGPTLKFATGRSRAAVSDLDGDGAPDIVVRTPWRLISFRNAGNAAFEEQTSIELEAPGEGSSEVPGSLQLADLDGNGRKDVITTKTDGGGTLVVMPGNGDGTVGTPLAFLAGPFARAGHVNGDQHLDVIAASGGEVRILTNTCAP